MTDDARFFCEKAYDDWFAELYDELYPELADHQKGPTRPVRQLIDMSTAFPSGRNSEISILDAACGTGHNYIALTRCKKGAHCRSGACPICSRRFRWWWTSHIAKQILSDETIAWQAVSLVPPDLHFLPGQLDQFEPLAFKDRLRKHLERSRLASAIAIGGIDFCVQRFEHAKRQPEWRPHAYFLIRGYDEAKTRRAPAGHYPACADTPRPIRVSEIKHHLYDALRVASYSFKTTFNERRPITDSNGNRDTEKTDLSDEYLIELAPLLDKWGYGTRMIRRGSLPDFPVLKAR